MKLFDWLAIAMKLMPFLISQSEEVIPDFVSQSTAEGFQLTQSSAEYHEKETFR